MAIATYDTCQKCPKGTDMALFYNTGTLAAQTWVEHCGIVEDLDINEVEEVQELTGRRDGRQVKEYNEGEIELSITGTQITDTQYIGWVILNAARNGGTPQDILVLTGDIATIGSTGWRGMWWNSDRTTRGPAAGNMTSAVNLQPAAPCVDPYQEVHAVQIASGNHMGDNDVSNPPYDPAAIVFPVP